MQQRLYAFISSDHPQDMRETTWMIELFIPALHPALPSGPSTRHGKWWPLTGNFAECLSATFVQLGTSIAGNFIDVLRLGGRGSPHADSTDCLGTSPRAGGIGHCSCIFFTYLPTITLDDDLRLWCDVITGDCGLAYFWSRTRVINVLGECALISLVKHSTTGGIRIGVKLACPDIRGASWAAESRWALVELTELLSPIAACRFKLVWHLSKIKSELISRIGGLVATLVQLLSSSPLESRIPQAAMIGPS
jgi:hypothetical protein